jgi:hypothetical protein
MRSIGAVQSRWEPRLFLPKETPMRPESIQTYLRAQPFRPFRIVMNSGKTYEVRHPEAASVGRDAVVDAEPGTP